MRIVNAGVDLDGVLSNFSYSFSKIIRSLYGDDMPLVKDDDMIKFWDWHLWYPASKEQISAAWEKLKRIENFWEYVQPFDTVVQLNELFRHSRVSVYNITTRVQTEGRTVVEQSARWLNDVSEAQFPQVIATKNKYDVINALNIEYFIDDNTFNVLDALVYTKANVYVVDYPYNRDVEGRLSLLPKRGDTYDAIDSLFKRLKRIKRDEFDVFVNDVLRYATDGIK